jgi:hypothetical protein
MVHHTYQSTKCDVSSSPRWYTKLIRARSAMYLPVASDPPRGYRYNPATNAIIETRDVVWGEWKRADPKSNMSVFHKDPELLVDPMGIDDKEVPRPMGIDDKEVPRPIKKCRDRLRLLVLIYWWRRSRRPLSWRRQLSPRPRAIPVRCWHVTGGRNWGDDWWYW